MALVLEAMDELPHHSAAAIARHRAIEFQLPAPALAANEFTLHVAIEGLGALPAKRRLDFRGACAAHAGHRCTPEAVSARHFAQCGG